MIISASRRTDIPAFYSAWLVNRIRAGSCEVANPYRRTQIKRVSLLPGDVDAMVFWTRYPRPLLPYLDELDQRGYRYYFQYTLTHYPRAIEPRRPALIAAVHTFRELAEKIGAQRVIWRYDPIYLSAGTPPNYHRENFQELAEALQGFSHRCVISLFDEYPKISRRVRHLSGYEPFHSSDVAYRSQEDELVRDLAKIAASNAMQIYSCAEENNLACYGVRKGKCIDDELLRQLFGLKLPDKKNSGQRKTCGCIVSQDIGRYDTCVFGCQYCYATRSFLKARQNYSLHNARSPSL